MTNRLHPLQSPKKLAEEIMLTGKMPDLQRCTGRTTVLALDYIKKSLEKPYSEWHVQDHSPAHGADLHLLCEIKDKVMALGLKGFYFNFQRMTVTYGDHQ
jgi:hypothetical protein